MTPSIVAFVDHEIGFRLLQKLIEHAHAGRINLVGVVTTVENGATWWPGVEGLCLEASLPLWRYQAPFHRVPTDLPVDWYLLLSWKHVLGEVLINAADKGCINLHYSLLPDYRGLYPVNWAIIEGRTMTGITYHRVNDAIDAGAVVLQATTSIRSEDTARTLQLRLDDLAVENFDALIERLLTDNPPLAEQRTASMPYKSRKAFEAACEIDLGRQYSGREIIDRLRGLTFFPNTRNAYFLDPATGRRIYVSLNIVAEAGD